MGSLFRSVSSVWRLNKFSILEQVSHRKLEVGLATRFNVPVRGGGRGTLLIGLQNELGFPGGPCLGSGEILLQARGETSRIQIGEGNWFSNNISIIANESVVIGDRCLFGEQVVIYDSDFHDSNPRTRHQNVGAVRPVSIGNNVWLGSRVMVLKGVSIGDNTVVGAMSVVTRSLPPNCIAAGNPARVLRSIG